MYNKTGAILLFEYIVPHQPLLLNYKLALFSDLCQISHVTHAIRGLKNVVPLQNLLLTKGVNGVANIPLAI